MNLGSLRRPLVLATAALALAAPTAAQAQGSGNEETVTLSGRAYVFNHMDTFIEGATIRVREDKKLTAVTDANGDYELEVPVDTTITPYIAPPEGYNEIDLQTFRTRTRDLQNVNFQTPADAEYNALAGLLTALYDIQFREDGRPEQCVIVTTASARNVRGVDYPTFWDRTPHGVAGATSIAEPELPEPTYFNEFVIPDPNQPSTSEDGGIIWPAVEDGDYRVMTGSPDADFASFLARCEGGRIVNANPPWGAYELAEGEKPLRAGTAVGGIDAVKSSGKSVKVKLGAAEALTARVKLKTGDRTESARNGFDLEPGSTTVKLPFHKGARGKNGEVVLKLEDAAGDKVKSTETLKLGG
jgi:hypothetical protein